MTPRRAAQIAAFREAAADRLSVVGVWWIQVESNVAAPTTVAEILRELHTLKGETAILGFLGAPELIHALEAAVTEQEDGIGEVVLQALDMLSAIVMAEPGTPVPPEVPSLVARLGGDQGDPITLTQNTPIEPVTEKVAARRVGLRVEAAKLDRMRDAIGDLMSLRIRLATLADELRAIRQDAGRSVLDSRLKRAEAQVRDDSDALTALASTLEETVRDLRLVPVGSMLERYPRIARDLGRDLSKNVRLVVEEESAVVDRDVIEGLDQAMVHIIRNAVDHGIEEPAVRKSRGKPELGTIKIVARVAAAQLHVTIADDGGGIDSAAVRRVAIERGLVDARADASDDKVLQWILLPGFTTRATATQVSGRGVGLDAVHATVQALGGSLTIASERHRGTTFQLSVPINTAITSVLLFRVGDGRYALPTNSVEDIIDGEAHRVEDSFTGPVVSFRGADLPVVSLPDLLGRPGVRAQRRRLVIVRSGFGLIACTGSAEHEHREAVLRPAGSLLSSQSATTAAIVLEDGAVALVLNPARLRREGAAHDAVAPVATVTVLIVDDSPIVHDLVSEVLRSHGVIVIRAGDGLEALDKLDEHPEVGLVVTDVEMPRMDGLQLLRRLRALPGRRIPAVVVSTRGRDEDKQLAASLGADAYLVKSDLTHDSLWTLIERFVA